MVDGGEGEVVWGGVEKSSGEMRSCGIVIEEGVYHELDWRGISVCAIQHLKYES